MRRSSRKRGAGIPESSAVHYRVQDAVWERRLEKGEQQKAGLEDEADHRRNGEELVSRRVAVQLTVVLIAEIRYYGHNHRWRTSGAKCDRDAARRIQQEVSRRTTSHCR